MMTVCLADKSAYDGDDAQQLHARATERGRSSSSKYQEQQQNTAEEEQQLGKRTRARYRLKKNKKVAPLTKCGAADTCCVDGRWLLDEE